MNDIIRIGVDLDGTLARYDGLEWTDYDPAKIGPPIPEMVERVRRWLAKGHDVVIFTARVCVGIGGHNQKEADISRGAIESFCMEQFGKVLEVTCVKDSRMKELWDDKAVSIERDTGRILTIGIAEREEAEEPDSLGSLL